MATALVTTTKRVIGLHRPDLRACATGMCASFSRTRSSWFTQTADACTRRRVHTRTTRQQAMENSMMDAPKEDLGSFYLLFFAALSPPPPTHTHPTTYRTEHAPQRVQETDLWPVGGPEEQRVPPHFPRLPTRLLPPAAHTVHTIRSRNFK